MAEVNYIRVREQTREQIRKSSSDPYLDDVMAMANYHGSHDFTSAKLAAFYEPRINPRDWEERSVSEEHQKSEDGSLEWVAANLAQLSKEFPNRFILVDNARVIADSEDIRDLLQRAAQLGLPSPLVIDTQLPSGVPRTVY